MDIIYIMYLLYASGVVTTLAVIKLLHYKHINKQLSKDLEVAIDGVLKSHEPERRVGNLIWNGWHKIEKPSVTCEYERRDLGVEEYSKHF